MKVADIKSRITLQVSRHISTAIIKEVAKKHNLTVDQMMQRSRKRPVAWARQEAFDRLYLETKASLPTIAFLFGMDHTTVLHGIWAHRKRKIEEETN
jgi:chromosomal replication initiation ATPase DnaA